MLGKLNRLRTNNYIKNALILFKGSSISQIIILAASPILTRLYSPSDFGTLSGYTSIVAILLVISSLTYEKAIPLERDKELAFYVVTLSLGLVLFSSFFVLAIFGISNFQILNLLNLKLDTFTYIIICISLVGAGFFQVLNYWSIRSQLYKEISYAKVTQSTVNVSTQLILKYVLVGSKGLLLGDMMGRIMGGGKLFREYMKENQKFIKSFDRKKLGFVLYKYRKFPLYSSFSVFLNSVSLQVPSILLINYYGTEIAGWFSLSQKVVAIPLSLIAVSLGQAYYGEATKLLKADSKKEVLRLFEETTKKIILIVSIPIILFSAFAPKLFVIIFGAEWASSGTFVQLLAVTFIIQAAILPVSQTLYIAEKQLLQLFWDLFRFILVVLAITIPYKLGFGAEFVVGVYSIVMTITYLVLYLFIFQTLKNKSLQGGEINDKK
ncbi:lipopolysaccharide biosynthesis protein [Priestia megaterium]|uniref:lipopolysaccharide biosynthesis protein n=1 Tax=Priestia megaterium TaxID=1404 RepID=UPI0015967891|nr:lipopolysaccharide biosynthesis protein [Priestia megaterium]